MFLSVFWEEAYLFFLAFFFAAILFSSELFKFRASMAGGARIQSSCINLSNALVKRKVISDREKMRTSDAHHQRSLVANATTRI